MTTIALAAPTAHAPDAPLPGEQWRPANGTEGHCFIDAWCSNCERDKVMNGDATDEDADRDESLYCTTLGESFRDGGTLDWRTVDGEVRCLRFIPKGEPAPERCPHTQELPL